jgi:quercetin dioxygenase-like cupin family protein
MSATDDPTRVFTSEELEWIPIPLVPRGEAWIKVIHADEERGNVIFRFRFSPDCELAPHTHECHATAYTISGEWEYEGLTLPAGAIAYEPVGSTHTPSSGAGAEIVVFLNSQSDQFLVNHLPDGTDVPFDMEFFKALQGATAEEAQRLVEQAAAENTSPA